MIVDASLGSGQMRKREFVSLLQTTTCATADAVLESVGQTTKGCPYIKKWLEHYKDQDAAHLMRAMHKYAPETGRARSAHEAIALVNQRVERAALSWAKTGKVTDLPEGVQEEMAGGGGDAGFLGKVMGLGHSGFGSALLGFLGGERKKEGKESAASGSAGAVQRKARDGGSAGTHDAAASLKQERTAKTARKRGSSAFGHDFSGVRVHTDAKAGELSDELNARAFTIGSHVAFGGGEYKPGTLVGDALIAHELAHVVQQGGGNPSGGPQTKDAALGDDSSLEQDADRSAVGAVVSALTGAKTGLAEIGANALPRLTSGLKLQRCPHCGKQTQVKSPRDVAPAATCKLDDAAGRLRQDLITSFGLADVTQQEGSCWTAAELTKVKNALAKMPAEQRSALKGVTLLRVKVSSCKGGDPQGCFRQDIDKKTGARRDVIELTDSAFDQDIDFEGKGNVGSFRTDMSGKKIESLPSQDVLLHEVGHATESASQRAASAAHLIADLDASQKQDLVRAAIQKINDAAVPTFNFQFSSNPKEAAYQSALGSASRSVQAMVDAIGDPSEASVAAIKKMQAGFQAALKAARAKVADLMKKKAALPPGSSVIMSDVEDPLNARVAAGGLLATAFEARLASQRTLESAEKVEQAASAHIRFGPKGGTDLAISRRLAGLIAMVELKGINIKGGPLRPYIKENWPDHPEELFADFYQWSITEPDGLKV